MPSGKSLFAARGTVTGVAPDGGTVKIAHTLNNIYAIRKMQ
jgi:hypothetical protein